MESEDESEISSSSDSDSDSEEESIEEEEEEDEEDEDTPSEPKAEERCGREKRKRKRKIAGHRRELRSKYESVEDFNPEARSAQTEEIERIRRLELQRSLQTGVSTVMGRGGAVDREGEPGREGPVVMDLAERKEERVEAIVISSDSEDEVGGEVTGGGEEVKRVKLSSEIKSEPGRKEGLGRYDVMGESEDGRIVVNLGHGEEEEDVILAPQIARIIKPHQVGGVRFLYDNLIESLSRFHTSTGFGCILAHSMGLGKTLQVISFIDLFLRHTPAKLVLCVVPVNTLQNWVAEFDKWLPSKEEERKKRSTEKGASKSRRSLQNGRLLQVPSPSELRRSSSPGLYELSSGPLAAPTAFGGQDSRASTQSVAMDTSSQVTGMSGPQHHMSHMQNNGDRLPPLTSLFSGENLEKSVFSPPGGNLQFYTTGGSDSRMSSPETPEIQYRSFRLFVLSDTVRSMEARLKTIKQWREEGGVLLIGYEMFRLLSLSVPSLGGNKMAVKRKKAKNQAAQNTSFVDLDENEREMEKLMEIQRGLCVPGPDLVVCDEGHRIKNDYTNISQALKKIQTRRRVVLTGYPLQNNLLEYWCMVDFVRPKYLGTKQEFGDLFERPISNGQCMDSTPEDVRTMRYRSHVLHTLLKGFVLRRGHEILKATLPSKFEHVLLVRPSAVQATLYDYNMNQMQQGGTSTTAGPLRAFAVCTKIWNHPDIYYNEARVQESKRSSPLSWLDEAGLPKTLLPKSESNSTCRIEWPTEQLSNLPPYTAGKLENSSKMVVVMEILDRSVQVGDKILVFSQSLSTLSYIENLLSQRPVPIPHSAGPADEVQYSNKKWTKNVNFCRLDGSTGSADRDRLINSFNSPLNQEMWVFLLSTRAGCLGINLVGANRVIVLDVSWNPCYDAQAVCRVYRYGQTKPCHIYRMVCDGTMERKIYDRQISKQGMADRVVDELQPERHFTADEIITLMKPLAPLPMPQDFSPYALHFSYDHVLTSLCKNLGPLLTRLPFKHESLLLDSANERMTEVEKFYAMKGFQQDWNARRQSSHSIQRSTSISPHPHQPIAAPPMATPTTTPTPLTSLGTSSFSNTRVGLPTRMISPSTNLSHSQSGSTLYGPGSNSGMGYGNVTEPPSQRPQMDDIIYLDLESDHPIGGANTAAVLRFTPGAAMSGTGSGIIPSSMSHSHATLLPGPKVLTVPISATAGHTHPSSAVFNSAALSHHLSFMRTAAEGGVNLEGAMATSNPLTTSPASSLSQNQPPLGAPSASSPQTTILSQALSSVLNPQLGQQPSVLGQQLSQQAVSAPEYNTAVPGQQMGHPTPNTGQLLPVQGQQTGRPASNLGQQMGCPASNLGQQMGCPMSNSGQPMGHPMSNSGQLVPVPGQQAHVPGQEGTHQTSTSETVLNQAVAPGQQVAHQLSLSRYHSTGPGQQVSGPGQPPTIPGQHTSIPGREASVGGVGVSTLPTLTPLTTPTPSQSSTPQPSNLWASSFVPLEKSLPLFPPPISSTAPGNPTLQTATHQQASPAHQPINPPSSSSLSPLSAQTQNSPPLVSRETQPTLPQVSQQTSGYSVGVGLSPSQQTQFYAGTQVLRTDSSSSSSSYPVDSSGIHVSSRPIMSPGHPVYQPAKSVQDSSCPIFSPPRSALPRDPSQGGPGASHAPSQKHTHVPSSSSPPQHPSDPTSPASSSLTAVRKTFSPPSSSHLHPSQTTPSPSPPLTSPRSQPPTPTTSIPLLSPVAAHLFQISMSKSPRPSPSPSHTPTPSPSHPHSSSSAPILSPPSATTTAASSSPVPKNSISSHSPLSPVHYHSNCSPVKTADSRTQQPHHLPPGLSTYHGSLPP